MTFFSVLLALILEQFHAVGRHNPVHLAVVAWVDKIERTFDAGEYQHGVSAWCVAVLPMTVLVALIHWALLSYSVLLAFAWNITIVYLTLGFRQFSHPFTAIHEALQDSKLQEARDLLHDWTGLDTDDMPQQEVARHTLERAIVAVHRHVFGVFFWFLVPIGPAGVVAYRTAEYIARHWSEPSLERSETLGQFARRAFEIMDWVPVRLTALGFAIVGNFEDAAYAWRHFAQKWPNQLEGILLAAGGGALGVRLGVPLAQKPSEEALEEDHVLIQLGEETSVRALQSAVGLVWRAVILWMLLLAMLTLAVWLG